MTPKFKAGDIIIWMGAPHIRYDVLMVHDKTRYDLLQLDDGINQKAGTIYKKYNIEWGTEYVQLDKVSMKKRQFDREMHEIINER